MTVIRKIGRREDDTSIEERKHTLFTTRHRAIPQLEMATVFFGPILVEVEQKIEPSIEIETFVFVEVGVNGETAAALDLMESAADEIRIRQKTGNPGHPLEKGEHRL